MDYCFFTEGAKATETDHENSTKAAVSMTVMLMVESLFRSMWAYAVQCKGATDEWLAEQIKDDLETIGLAGERLIIKADQEPAITEVQRAVAAARATSGTAMEQARVGDSNSNGRVERAIQDFKGLTRTLRSALEARTGTKISLEDPIVPWMVRHAAQIINVCRVREDGQTAWQKMTGRRFYGKMVPFAEMVMFKIPKTKHRVGSFEDRWELGCWVGIVPRSGEHLVATDTGVHKVSTIKRRMASERWSAEWVKGIVGSPAEPMPGSTMRPKHRLMAYAKRLPDDRVATATYVPAAEPADIPEFRAAKIYQRDVETFGGSEKCPGCRAAAKGGKYKMSHTFECRQRFERLLKEDFRAKQRFDKAAERRWTGITNKAMPWIRRPHRTLKPPRTKTTQLQRQLEPQDLERDQWETRGEAKRSMIKTKDNYKKVSNHRCRRRRRQQEAPRETLKKMLMTTKESAEGQQQTQQQRQKV